VFFRPYGHSSCFNKKVLFGKYLIELLLRFLLIIQLKVILFSRNPVYETFYYWEQYQNIANQAIFEDTRDHEIHIWKIDIWYHLYPYIFIISFWSAKYTLARKFWMLNKKFRHTPICCTMFQFVGMAVIVDTCTRTNKQTEERFSLRNFYPIHWASNEFIEWCYRIE